MRGAIQIVSCSYSLALTWSKRPVGTPLANLPDGEPPDSQVQPIPVPWISALITKLHRTKLRW